MCTIPISPRKTFTHYSQREARNSAVQYRAPILPLEDPQKVISIKYNLLPDFGFYLFLSLGVGPHVFDLKLQVHGEV
jgi:hypothetical protein